MGPGRGGSHNPWICSQTHICCQTCYQLRYTARLNRFWVLKTAVSLRRFFLVSTHNLFFGLDKGSLTVLALYAYFSDSQNSVFVLLVWCMQYQCNRWILWQEPASKIFSKFLRTCEIWQVESGGGLKFNDNEKWFKKWFLHFFLIYLVGMVKSIEHIICRVLTNQDNCWNCFKNKICFEIKWFWGDNL